MIETLSSQTVIRVWSGETALIYQSWLRCYIDDGLFTKAVPRNISYPNHKRLVDGILAKSQVIVLSPEDDLDQILGYVVAEPIGDVGVVHFIYVKRAFRRFGFARRLLNMVRSELHSSINSSMFCTHMTRDGGFLKKHGLVYNPYLLFRSEYHDFVEPAPRESHSSIKRVPGGNFLSR